MRVLISGSNGFIGSALVAELTRQRHEVVRLVRTENTKGGEISWRSNNGRLDPFELEGFDAVVHLGGSSLGEKRWTEAERGRIWDSRIPTTEALAAALAQTIKRPAVFITASGIGHYGNRGDETLTEQSGKGEGFLADVTKHWEESAEAAIEAGIRTVHLRTGLVLGDGGLLGRLLPVFRFGMGGRLGSGKQWMPWISLRDEVAAIVFAIERKSVRGPINLCNPTPVTNLDFTYALGQALRRPAIIPVFPWMLKLAFGTQMTEEMLLVSQRAVPQALLAAGFRFRDTDLSKTLEDIVRRPAELTVEKSTEVTGKSKRGKKQKKAGPTLEVPPPSTPKNSVIDLDKDNRG